MIDLIEPDWNAPGTVKAFSTTRLGGYSQAPWSDLNLSTTVGDEPLIVSRNRHRLIERANLPGPPDWLDQVHENRVIQCGAENKRADASISFEKARICAVLTADCLPILLCDRAGKKIAAVHAGWRGLAAGVIEASVASLCARDDELIAWLGPAIGPGAFEVGDEVRNIFSAHDAAAKCAFLAGRPGHWFADLYTLARQRLIASGVFEISGGGFCTYTEKDHFFSYRRDGITGRMATFIWLSEE